MSVDSAHASGGHSPDTSQLFRLRRRLTGTWSHARWWAAGAIGILWPVGPSISGLALMTVMLGVLVATVVWETVAVRRSYPSIENAGLRDALQNLGR
jgi:hypothetical protein